ncbi:MAG: pirin family protein [Bdellovibrionales bacterium]|nr:pirin family protein [Bdellovibrionales bacterium]
MSWKVRKSSDRGHFDHGWLKTAHSFSFSQYLDRNWMGYRALRVINEDWVAAGEGFDPHPHDNMEIITVVLEGALRHEDSMGNGSIIGPGDVQRMSAGSGILHSEFNSSSTEPVHLLQIWILPDQKSVRPSYEQKSGVFGKPRSGLTPLAVPESTRQKSGPSAMDAVSIYQEARVFGGFWNSPEDHSHCPSGVKFFWCQVISGELEINGVLAQAGDALYSEKALGDPFSLWSKSGCRFLLFELS